MSASKHETVGAGVGRRMAGWSARALLVALPVSAMIAGCGSAKKTEVASLAAAVERFERAPTEQRVSMAAGVGAVPCQQADVKPVCELCARGADETARALTLKVEVERAMAEEKKGNITHEQAEAMGLRDKVDDALDLVGKAKQDTGDCDARLMTLKRNVGL